MPPAITARHVVKQLKALSSAGEAAKVKRFFRGNDDGQAADNKFMAKLIRTVSTGSGPS